MERTASTHRPHPSLVQVVAARLLTGPMWVKYQSVLRYFASEKTQQAHKKDGSAPPGYVEKQWQKARDDFRRLCCKGDESTLVERKGNTYSNTLHVANSAILKLSYVTKLEHVYCGMSSDVTLDETFFEESRFGAAGGSEATFVSASRDRDAVMLQTLDELQPVMLEVADGMLSRGADVSPLAQFKEDQVIFAPLVREAV